MKSKEHVQLDLEHCHAKICQLVEKFEANKKHYLSGEYLEAEVRKDFIDPFFKHLGWDVDHKHQHDVYRQDVKIEHGQRRHGESGKKFADYAFFREDNFKDPVFYVEAKRPVCNLEDNKEYYLQTHKYGWNTRAKISVLTDFEEFIIIDCRPEPSLDTSIGQGVRSYRYTDYLDLAAFKEIFYLFSRTAVLEGSIDNFVENHLARIKTQDRSRSVDASFLSYFDKFRERLAQEFYNLNPDLSEQQLTEATQKTIDRIIFIRFLEDKQIEYESHIHFIKTWNDFITLSKRLDGKYNGVVFKPSHIDSKQFKGASDDFFRGICEEISSTHSPYNFNLIPIHIIGNIYERFLSKVVKVEHGKVCLETKPEVRKAGGVFYTPKYIVDDIVAKTVGKKIHGKSPKEIDEMSFADISCGSGSFLIGVYDCLLDYHKSYYTKKHEGKTKLRKSSSDASNVEYHEGNWRVTLKRKQEILLNCIFGVDIDHQAVQVAQLSLFLKLLEEETIGSTTGLLFTKVLPDLTNNVKCGNSLIDWSISENLELTPEQELTINPFDFRSEFFSLFEGRGGFDAIVGNPPYIKEPKAPKSLFHNIKNSYLEKYYEGKMDLWYFFVSNGIDLIVDDGFVGFIAPNNWTTNKGAKKMRQKILSDTEIVEMVDFDSYMIFEDASIQTMNFILRKVKNVDQYSLYSSKLQKPECATENQVIETLKSSAAPENKITIKPTDYLDKYLLLHSKRVTSLLKKIASKQNFELEGRREMTQGILAPQESISKKHSEIIDAPIGQGVFYLSNDEVADMKLTVKEQSLIRPFFTSTETLRFCTIHNNLYNVIYTGSEFKNPEAMADYPILRMHLDQFQEIITSDNKPYGLHRARSEQFFKGEKILVLRKSTSLPVFSWSDFDAYVSQTFNVIKTDRVDMRYLTAFLSSNVVAFWLLKRGKMQGKNYQLDSEPLQQIPIYVPKSSSTLKSVISIFEEIVLTIKVKTDAPLGRDFDFYERKLINCENRLNSIFYSELELDQSDIDFIEREIEGRR